MDQIKVLIADKMDPKAAAIFRERGIAVDEKPGLSPNDLESIAHAYDGIAVRSSMSPARSGPPAGVLAGAGTRRAGSR